VCAILQVRDHARPRAEEEVDITSADPGALHQDLGGPSRTTTVLGLLREGAKPRRRLAGYAVAIGGTLALVALFLPFRDEITPLSKGFGFVVPVVVAAAVGGLGPGITASILGFLTFNFFFIPPYDTFVIARAEYVVVLFVFLGLSVLISILIARAGERADAAEARETELRTLQDLSRVLVVQGPGPETYETLLDLVIRDFDVRSGALFVQGPGRGLERRVAVGAGGEDLEPTWDPRAPGPAPERLPLSVGGRTLGLIVLTGDRPTLSPAESRVLRSLCDQLALVLERDRLLRAATDAEIYRQSEQMRKALLAAVSHDLRSPLAAIKASATDLLAGDVPRGDREYREILETIDREADRLNAIIANLLDMSRIETGVLKPRIEVVDLVETLRTESKELAGRFPSVRIVPRFADPPTLVEADPAFLDRVVFNLLDNAAKAAAQHGDPKIELELRSEPDRAIVRVIDHGEGIPPTARTQLFFPFYGLRERGERLGPGLGLAIAKGFLSLMSGEIWIEDTPGGGATFAFSLPRWIP
jgi:two-component system sensor histidine kinase KdpD